LGGLFCLAGLTSPPRGGGPAPRAVESGGCADYGRGVVPKSAHPPPGGSPSAAVRRSGRALSPGADRRAAPNARHPERTGPSPSRTIRPNRPSPYQQSSPPPSFSIRDAPSRQPPQRPQSAHPPRRHRPGAGTPPRGRGLSSQSGRNTPPQNRPIEPNSDHNCEPDHRHPRLATGAQPINVHHDP
jgi:hypothetical protein